MATRRPGRGKRTAGATALLAEAGRRPAHALSVLGALVKGRWYKVTYPLVGIRFRAGTNLRVFGSLDIRGPGEVELGDDVMVLGDARLWTHAREARISVGDNVMMGDTEFGCIAEISVGRDCILARSSIDDTDFHSTHVNRRSAEAPVHVAPVHLEDNVWIAKNVSLLPGTRIGQNSVVACSAVCGRAYPANAIIAGSPARVVGAVPQAEVPAAGGAVAADAVEVS